MKESSTDPFDGLLALATSDVGAEELLSLAADCCLASGAQAVSVHRPAEDGPDLLFSRGGPAEGSRTEVAVETTNGTYALLTTQGAPDPGYVRRVAEVAGSAISRRQREDTLTRSIRHFVAAQRISHVGSYDFDIRANTNDWSDQLYRIYGREPQSFMATYEKFLEMVHPDDREKIVGVHQEALATLSPYDMEERIVWPDGQVRTLASWGEVVPGPDGAPARMVGICWDITEQKSTAAALARSSERFQRLIQSSPDVVLVVSQDGKVQQVNQRVRDVLGWEPAEVMGRPVTELVPAGLGEATGSPRELVACQRDGTELPVEVSTSEIETEEGAVTAAFVRDLRDRKRSEELALRLHDADVRRRHALEINDNVVQGLASVLYLLDLDRSASAHAAARRTMATARAMMDDLLQEAGSGTLAPGELVRGSGHAATLQDVVPPQPPAPAGALRVLLADDAEDIRLLLRLTLTTTQGFEIVGEAADGEQAIRLAAQHQPDVILLDLSMPVLDGLQAIPEIARVSPDTRIVVLSGFDEARMKPVALELGAVAYLEKGEATADLLDTMATLFPAHPIARDAQAPDDPDAYSGLAFDGDMVVHELRTPLTVITGMLATLRDRIDVLPSATTAELIGAAARNARQMAELLDAVSDARRASHGQLPVVPEPTDLAKLVHDAAADIAAGHGAPAPDVRVAAPVQAHVDPMRIRQVIVNLLSNAFKFATPESPVTITVTSDGRMAEVVVHDDGPGIPEDRRDELFTKFGRLGRSGHGMGLGLYISRAIARAHGGELELRDGPGATFALTLPFEVASEAGTSTS